MKPISLFAQFCHPPVWILLPLRLSLSNAEVRCGFQVDLSTSITLSKRDGWICRLSPRKSTEIQGGEFSYLKMCDSSQANFSSQILWT